MLEVALTRRLRLRAAKSTYCGVSPLLYEVPTAPLVRSLFHVCPTTCSAALIDLMLHPSAPGQLQCGQPDDDSHRAGHLSHSHQFILGSRWGQLLTIEWRLTSETVSALQGASLSIEPNSCSESEQSWSTTHIHRTRLPHRRRLH